MRAELSDIAEWDAAFQSLIQDAVLVADHYGVRLILPKVVTNEDVVSLVTLKRLITGELTTLNDIAVTLVKTEEKADHFRQLLSKENGNSGIGVGSRAYPGGSVRQFLGCRIVNSIGVFSESRLPGTWTRWN